MNISLINDGKDSNTGKWFLFSWWPDTCDHSIIHQDDLASMMATYPHGRVFYCAGNDSEYLFMVYCNEVFRIKPNELLKEVSDPRFYFGDQVKEFQSPERIKIINDIVWHFRKNKPYFLLSIDNKVSSKWVFADEIEMIAPVVKKTVG